MFKRAHHQRIARVLAALDSDLLQQAQCYFAGGTAIVLLLDEYRESLDIDFLCASADGYRQLRNWVTDDLGPLQRSPLTHLRQVRADRYGIRTTLVMDGVAIKLEFVSEGRIAIEGGFDPVLQIPTLARADMFAEKLLANADRGLDRSTMSRDMIDLAMMIRHWGPIPQAAWAKVDLAYGAQARRAFAQALALIEDEAYLAACLQKMQMDSALLPLIRASLQASM
ncbi:MAG: hypothetical protein RL748_2075 [Pseudomonadota bacterium]|jgi:hypothetical protein